MTQSEIIKALRILKKCCVKEISQVTGKSKGAVLKALNSMERYHEAKRIRDGRRDIWMLTKSAMDL